MLIRVFIISKSECKGGQTWDSLLEFSRDIVKEDFLINIFIFKKYVIPWENTCVT